MTKLQKDTIKNWLASAKEDRDTANDMFKLKRYAWCLFMYQLSIEKLFKTQLLKNNQRVPHTHKLLKLARLAKIKFSVKQEIHLIIITEFNVSARYDIEKMEFYKRANKEYAKHWMKICEEIFNQLKNLI